MKHLPNLALWLGTLTAALACQSEPEHRLAGAGGAPVGSAGMSAAAGSSTVAGSGGSAQAGSASAGMNSGGGTGSSVGGAGSDAGGQSSAGTGGAAGSGGAGELPPLEECTSKPSIDRLTEWIASGEGATVPATGSILVKDGADYVGKVQFVGSESHVIPVYILNEIGETADLTSSKGITLTYSATSELHVQLRSESHWSGGDQYATTIASTGGEKKTQFISFEAAGWKSLFGAPALSYADTLKEGMGLVFVGNSENTVVFYGLRIDGVTPPCQ
jgi:hypothetical protein